jgi:hypothetical protein
MYGRAGVGQGKMKYLAAELGEPALRDRAIKRAQILTTS